MREADSPGTLSLSLGLTHGLLTPRACVNFHRNLEMLGDPVVEVWFIEGTPFCCPHALGPPWRSAAAFVHSALVASYLQLWNSLLEASLWHGKSQTVNQLEAGVGRETTQFPKCRLYRQLPIAVT